MDQTTEAIAHFIGLFSQAVEDARLRLEFEEFQALKAQILEQSDLLTIAISVHSPYSFKGLNPSVEYTPPPVERFHEKVTFPVWHDPIPLNLEGFSPGRPVPSIEEARATHNPYEAISEYEPIGSLALYLKQQARLMDNDYLSIGDHGLLLRPMADMGPALVSLLEQASPLQPFANLNEPGSVAEIGDFISQAPHIADAFLDSIAGSDAVFFMRSETIEGGFVNGTQSDALPALEDHLPERHESTEPDDQDQTVTDFSDTATMTIGLGANLLVNEAVLINDWYAAPVLAVAGDYASFNLVSQSNVWSDNDHTSQSLSGWDTLDQTPTQAFNVASFRTVENPAPTGAQTEPDAPTFPSYWQVSRIDGDFMLINWIKQVSFVEDQDITIMSAAGGGTEIILGDNSVMNATSLATLGYYYDLIIVGGNVYNANIISQTNVLLDDDLVGSVAGFETHGDASISTNGNLLWNEASITQYGTISFEALPSAFLGAVNDLSEGTGAAPRDVLTGPDFAGLTHLKVLYISGDLVDLQYLSQINVLGDADQVALARDQSEAHADASWSLSTGANALINYAAIIDGGVNTTVYAGGSTYSDELLIQAELIASESDLYTQSADALVNEAVAFLSEDMIAPREGGHDLNTLDTPTPEPASADVMQTMLG
ncbi:type I secretion protein [Nitratireductor sp. GISD-1A_MAKvit]|uniref:type I secretion protein n=1 Tax=Nitratireductor sp. GISD-1A_MAKvit TaxID=3234198 RepID=UPI0034677CFD